MGLDFYRRAMALVEKYRRPGMTFLHTMQTNGTLLDDDWCAFFKEHNFLHWHQHRWPARAARHLPRGQRRQAPPSTR
jgi:hypothetical protein